MKISLEWFATTGADFSAGAEGCRYAHLSHYTAAYCEWGQGPPLVLVPGLAGGFELLGPLARLLAKDFRVISYQLRGEDDCFALRQRFQLADLAGDLAEFLDWCALERPAVFGVSFGGAVALELAARFPHHLGALVVQGAGARMDAGLLQQIAGSVLARYPLPPNSPFVNQFFHLLFGRHEPDGPLFEFVTRRCWQTDQGVMAHRFRLAERFEAGDRLRHVTAPALLMAGERDLLVSDASLQTLCDALPDARVRLLKGCGHLAFVTAPEVVAAHVRRFLDRRR